MSQQILCDGPVRVFIDGFGDRTLFVVNDGATIRFWTDTSVIEGVLKGHPIQMSALGGYCTIEVIGDTAKFEFAVDGHAREQCQFSATSLASALSNVRNAPPPEN